jgi:hypothetical protein
MDPVTKYPTYRSDRDQVRERRSRNRVRWGDHSGGNTYSGDQGPWFVWYPKSSEHREADYESASHFLVPCCNPAAHAIRHHRRKHQRLRQNEVAAGRPIHAQQSERVADVGILRLTREPLTTLGECGVLGPLGSSLPTSGSGERRTTPREDAKTAAHGATRGTTARRKRDQTAAHDDAADARRGRGPTGGRTRDPSAGPTGGEHLGRGGKTTFARSSEEQRGYRGPPSAFCIRGALCNAPQAEIGSRIDAPRRRLEASRRVVSAPAPAFGRGQASPHAVGFGGAGVGAGDA